MIACGQFMAVSVLPTSHVRKEIQRKIKSLDTMLWNNPSVHVNMHDSHWLIKK